MIIWLLSGWWFQPLWKIWLRQLGWLFPIYGKKRVPNHQSVMYCYPLLHHEIPFEARPVHGLPGPRRPTLTARALNGLHRVQGQDHQHGSHGALQGMHGDPEMARLAPEVWDVIWFNRSWCDSISNWGCVKLGMCQNRYWSIANWRDIKNWERRWSAIVSCNTKSIQFTIRKTWTKLTIHSRNMWMAQDGHRDITKLWLHPLPKDIVDSLKSQSSIFYLSKTVITRG